MPQFIVVPLKLPVSYTHQSFENQLANIVEQICNVAKILGNHLGNNASQWLITWQEYGLTNSASERFISEKQKQELKTTMQNLTIEYPKLCIVSGTVATTRWIDGENNERWTHTIDKINKAYGIKADDDKTPDENTYFNTFNCEFRKEKEKSTRLLKRKKSFNLGRNTAYAFSEGKCIARHDKITPWKETQTLSHGIFRPGTGRNQSNLLTNKLGLEICMEHQIGVLVQKLANGPPPLIQLILSASTDLVPKNCVSPYVIHIDSNNPIRFLTHNKVKSLEVSVYAYSASAPNILTVIEPQTIREYLIEDIQQEMDKEAYLPCDINELIYDNFGNSFLDVSDLMFLLHSAIRKYCNDTMSFFIDGDHKAYIRLNHLRPILKTLLLQLVQCKDLSPESNRYKKLLLDVIKHKDLELLSILIKNYHTFFKEELLNKHLLKFIIQMDNLELFKILFEHALIDQAITKRKDTALHLAVNYNSEKITTYLLQRNSNLSLTNRQGKTAFDLAKELYSRYDPIVKLLTDYQTTKNIFEESLLANIHFKKSVNSLFLYEAHTSEPISDAFLMSLGLNATEWERKSDSKTHSVFIKTIPWIVTEDLYIEDACIELHT